MHSFFEQQQSPLEQELNAGQSDVPAASEAQLGAGQSDVPAASEAQLNEGQSDVPAASEAQLGAQKDSSSPLRAQGVLPPYVMSLYSMKDGKPFNQITGGEISLTDTMFIKIHWAELAGVAAGEEYFLDAYSDKLTAALADGLEAFKISNYPGALPEGKEFVTLSWKSNSRVLGVNFKDMGWPNADRP